MLALSACHAINNAWGSVAAQLLWFWVVTIGAHVVANQSQCPDLVFFCGFLLLGAGLRVISTRSKL